MESRESAEVIRCPCAPCSCARRSPRRVWWWCSSPSLWSPSWAWPVASLNIQKQKRKVCEPRNDPPGRRTRHGGGFTSFVGIVSGVLPVHLVLRAVAVLIRMDHAVIFKGDGHYTEERSNISAPDLQEGAVESTGVMKQRPSTADLCCLRWTSSPRGAADRQTRGRTAAAASGPASGHCRCRGRPPTADQLQGCEPNPKAAELWVKHPEPTGDMINEEDGSLWERRQDVVLFVQLPGQLLAHHLSQTTGRRGRRHRTPRALNTTPDNSEVLMASSEWVSVPAGEQTKHLRAFLSATVVSDQKTQGTFIWGHFGSNGADETAAEGEHVQAWWLYQPAPSGDLMVSHDTIFTHRERDLWL